MQEVRKRIRQSKIFPLTRTRTAPPSPKHLLLVHHNPLIANINKHLKLGDLLIALPQLALELVHFLLPVLLDLSKLVLSLGDFGSQLGAEFFFKGHGGFFVEGGEGFHGGGFDAGGVALDGGAGVVDVAGEVADAGVVAVEEF